MQVLVRDNNVDQALRALKKKMQREGVFREMKLRRNYEKPSERRAREKAEAVRRFRKLLRKRMEREEVLGFIIPTAGVIASDAEAISLGHRATRAGRRFALLRSCWEWWDLGTATD